jgi:hypothetical protein
VRTYPTCGHVKPTAKRVSKKEREAHKAMLTKIAEHHHRRSAALKLFAADIVAGKFDLDGPIVGPFHGLVVVRCGTCQRPIATTKEDQKRRPIPEPPILLDFPEYAGGWTCTTCSRAFTVVA